MKIKTTLAVIALALVPAVASAQCATKRTTASACAAGQVLDTETGRCIVAPSS